MPKTALIATAKNEGPWLLEWVAHYKSLGFDQIALATNDCDDGTDQIARRLSELGEILYLDNPEPYPRKNDHGEPSIQLSAYERLQALPEIQACEWVMPVDLDEFLVIHLGNGQITDLIDAYPDAEGILVRWRIFGDGGISGFPPLPLCDHLTTCAAKENSANSSVKMLVRNHQSIELEMHMSLRKKLKKRGFLADLRRRVEGLQTRAPIVFDGKTYHFDRAHGNLTYMPYFENKALGFSDAQLNHYAIRTVELAQLKAARGDGYKDSNKRYDQSYLSDLNCNEVKDTAIQKYKGERDRYLSKYLSDPELDALHKKAIKITKDKLRA